MKDNLHDATLAAAASAANMHKSHNRISSDVAVAEKLVHVNDELNDAPSQLIVDNSSGQSNQTIIVCIHLNSASMPKWPNKCVSNQVS